MQSMYMYVFYFIFYIVGILVTEFCLMYVTTQSIPICIYYILF
jgi:hypothetical protein